MATAINFAGLTIPPAAAINAAAAPRTLAGAGARALVPLTYGENRVSALILNVIKHATDANIVYVVCLWGHACQAVDTLRLNDQALPGTATTTSYTGSQSTADASLVSAFAAQGITYTDTLAGYAYSVVGIQVRDFDGQLNFSARVQGRKLYDPRLDSTNGGSGTHRLATPSTWAYSANPSLALADWLYSTLYGAGETVLWSSVITTANANDSLIGSPTETHRRIGVTFTQAVPAPDMAEALRAYAGVWLIPTSGGVKLLSDATAASAATYAHSSGQIANIDALSLRDLGNSPTVVEVVYTDASLIPYRDASAFALRAGAGTTLPWRQSTVRLPGIQRYGQAVREATERLNKLYLSDLSTTLEVFDGGIAHEVGDVVTVSHPVGLVSKLFRISAPPEMYEPGRWRLPLAEYDAAVYSTAVATAPTSTDAGFISSVGPPPNVTTLAASVVTGGVRISWDAAPVADYDYTELRTGASWAAGTRIFKGAAADFVWLSPTQGTYTVRARHWDTTGNVSAADASISVTVDAGVLVDWTALDGRPAVFRVSSRGYASTQHQLESGLYNGETGATLVSYGTYWRAVKINRTTAVVTSLYSGNDGASFCAALDAVTDSGHIIVVYSWDEPQNMRTTHAPVYQSMYNHGASRAVFGSPSLLSRSSYILVGISRCGEGGGFEAYQGVGGSGGSNDWCEASFTLQHGQAIVSGGGRTLTIGTEQLEPEAATAVTLATDTDKTLSRTGTNSDDLVITGVAAGLYELSFSASWDILTWVNSTFMRSYLNTSPGGNGFTGTVYGAASMVEQWLTSSVDSKHVNIVVTLAITATSDVAIRTLCAGADGYGGDSSISTAAQALRLTRIKR